MYASQVENVLTYCLKNSACRHNDRSSFLSACDSLPFEILAQALSASQLTGLFVSALDGLELIPARVAAINVRLRTEIIIRNRFNNSLLHELTRLCNTKPHHIQAIMLGGPGMWSGIYQQAAERHSEDLDLFFWSDEDFDSVAGLASNLGYSPMRSETLNLASELNSPQRLALTSSLYYLDLEIVLNKQEASAYRQLHCKQLNTYSITEVTPARFVIRHFLELHKLSPAGCASNFSAQHRRYVRASQFAEHLYELDMATLIVFSAFKYREKIENGSFCKPGDAKRLKLIGDFIRLIDNASCEQIVQAKLLAQRCGLSTQLADLLASVLRINPSLPFAAVDNIIARPGNNAILNAISSCSLMLTNTPPFVSEPLLVRQRGKVAGRHMR